jgi:hypothetical protein
VEFRREQVDERPDPAKIAGVTEQGTTTLAKKRIAELTGGKYWRLPDARGLERRESCHAGLLGEDPGMASSSKGPGSSRKQSSAAKARVISAKRKDALPRTGSVSEGRRKPVVMPPIDAVTEPLAAAVAAPKKKAHSVHQKEPTASRKKTTRAAGRASAKLDKPAAMEVAQTVAVPETVDVAAPAPVDKEFRAGAVEAPALISPAIEPAMVAALDPVAETVGPVEPPASAYEEFAVSAAETPEVAALAVVDTELAVEASAIVEELPLEAVSAPNVAIAPPPIPEAARGTPLARTTAESPAPAPPAPHHERRSRMPAISRLLSTLYRWTGVSGPR